MKLATAMLLLLLSYRDWPIIWEGVVGIEQLDECTEQVWYERIYSNCPPVEGGQCMMLFELSVYQNDLCPVEPGPDRQMPLLGDGGD